MEVWVNLGHLSQNPRGTDILLNFGQKKSKKVTDRLFSVTSIQKEEKLGSKGFLRL